MYDRTELVNAIDNDVEIHLMDNIDASNGGEITIESKTNV